MSAQESMTIVQNVLSTQGYDFNDIKLADKRFVQICRNGRPLLVVHYEYPLYPFVTSSARLICRHKDMAYEFVRGSGVAVPETVIVKDGDISEALSLLARHGSVIVKPKSGLGSKGLHLDVTTENELTRAIGDARQYASAVLVQRQFYGEEVRFVVIKGRVLAALLRQKPRVMGDGISTLAELIRKENAERLAIKDTLIAYPQLDASLVRQDLLESDEVVALGETRELNKSTMIRGGASIYNITDDIHPGYKALAEKAAAGLGSGFVVVDIMIADHLVPPTDSNYVFIEFNLAPALALFYSCRDGKQVRIVEDYMAPMLIEVMDCSL